MLRAIVKIGSGSLGSADGSTFRTAMVECPELEAILAGPEKAVIVGFEWEGTKAQFPHKVTDSDYDHETKREALAWKNEQRLYLAKSESSERARQVTALKAENAQRENVLDDLEFRQQAYAELQRRTEQASAAKTEQLTEEQNRFGQLWVLKKLDGEYVRSTSDEGAPAALVFFSEHDAGKAAEYQAKFFDISSTPVRVV